MPLLASVLAAARPAKPAPAGTWGHRLVGSHLTPFSIGLHPIPCTYNLPYAIPHDSTSPVAVISSRRADIWTQMRSGNSGPTLWQSHTNGCKHQPFQNSSQKYGFETHQQLLSNIGPQFALLQALCRRITLSVVVAPHGAS